MINIAKKLSKKDIIILFLTILASILLVLLAVNWTSEEKTLKYSVRDLEGLRVGYSIDMMDDTAIEYEITPEVAAYIAKGVFTNIYGEKYVNERELKVFENSQLLSDVEKYGDFYTVGLNYQGHTDGKYIEISKIDGRILKVYWFG